MRILPYRRRLRLKKGLRVLAVVLAVAVVAVLVALLYVEPYIIYDREGAHLQTQTPTVPAETSPSPQRPVVENPTIVIVEDEPLPETVLDMGGYYITTAMLQQPQKVLDTLKTLEPCAVMMEVKSIYGNFYYSTSISDAPRAEVDIDTIDQIISYLSRNDFYMVAVVPAFVDPAFALENIPCGLPLASGALWMDNNGCYWLDPVDETVLSYLMQVARELSSLGFREVAFSNFLFPTSNNIHYPSEKTADQLILEAAEELTDFFAGSNLLISFVTDDTAFAGTCCAGRIYVPNVDGSKIDRYLTAYADFSQLQEVVFLASSRDVRFEDQAVLRPLVQ